LCRVLILDDDVRFAESLRPVVKHFDDNEITSTDIAFTLDDALDLAKTAVQIGQPYTVFLVDQRLGPGKDGIAAMGDLRNVSPSSDAIIFTGIDDPEIGIRAYEAGAFRYLTKPIEVKELEFVLHALMQSRREVVENKWRKVFSEMMETVLLHDNFNDVAKVVVNYSVHLGFERAHLFSILRQADKDDHNYLVGVACAGDKCLPSFSEIRLDLTGVQTLIKALHSDDSVFIYGYEYNECVDLAKDVELIGLQIPVSGMWILPLWSGQELLGVLFLDFGSTIRYLSEHEHILLDFFARLVAVTISNVRNINELRRQLQQPPLKVFLCYSKRDNDRVMNLYRHLKEQREIIPWIDKVDLLPGVDWDQEIQQAVRNSDVVLVCLSEKSLSNDGYVHKELRIALDTAEKKPDGTIYIIPLRLEECRVPERLGRWQWLDYFVEPKDGFERLMTSLRKRAASLYPGD
jgi:DNA-binding response OmpR family regulator